MSEEQKKEEGTTSDEKKIGIVSKNSADEEKSDEGKTIGEMESEKARDNKIKNLIAVLILLSGVVAGSFFVDVAQFVSGSGYSEKALKTADIFEGGGKTWVAYPDPAVELKVLTVSDDELKSCANCDPTEVLTWMKRFVPTLVAKKVTADSEEGKKLLRDYHLKTIPAFVFNDKIRQSSFYQGEAKMLFEEKNGFYVLNASSLGVPIGKYLETPNIDEDDSVIGNKDAKVKIIVFSDFQCPYCKVFYSTITKVAKEYGDKVALVYKEMPLDFHPQAKSSSQAALCAKEQGKFWEMATMLYDNQESWGKAEGKAVLSFYDGYAKKAGLNMNQFNECYNNSEYSDIIEKDSQVAAEFGISGTPSGFVGQQFIGGVLKEDDLKKMIDDELAK